MALSKQLPLEHYFNRKVTDKKDALCYEMLRLKTFTTWPQAANAFPSQLAQAGFSYTRSNDEVVCFSCHIVIGKWRKEMFPLEEHKRRNPNCDFVRGVCQLNIPIAEPSPDVTDYMNKGGPDILEVLLENKLDNIYLTSRSEEPSTVSEESVVEEWSIPYQESLPSEPVRSPQDSNGDGPLLFAAQMTEEASRLETFRVWPNRDTIDPKYLVKTGLYYTGVHDVVRCAFCNGTLSGFRPGDVPSEIHVRLHPSCQYAREHQRRRHQEEAVPVGAQPKHPRFASLESRTMSFQRWPRSHTQHPNDMALAGFFYAGMSDCVKCFHCDGGLRNWLEGDDPWIEHAHWYPSCGYLQAQQTYYVCDAMRDEAVQQNQRRSNYSPPAESIPQRGGNVEGQATLNTPGRGKAFVPSVVGQSNGDTSRRHGQSGDEAGNQVIPNNLKGKTSADGSNSDNDPDVRSLMEENRELQEKTLCKICLTEPCQVTFLPCGHLVACTTCCTQLRKCPICRAAIKGRVRVFLA